MSDSTVPSQVANIIAMHRTNASQSAYDHKVAILAVGSAAGLIEQFDWTGNLQADLESLVPALVAFRDNYYDSDGEYTSGKGEIGSLLADISYLLSELQES